MQPDGLLVAFTMYPGLTDGYVETPFRAIAATPPFDALETRQEIQRRLNEIPQVSIPLDRLDKYPSIPIIALADPTALNGFVATADWIIREVLAARQQLG